MMAVFLVRIPVEDYRGRLPIQTITPHSGVIWLVPAIADNDERSRPSVSSLRRQLAAQAAATPLPSHSAVVWPL